jgi:DNA-binding transcriptional regulator YiaG
METDTPLQAKLREQIAKADVSLSVFARLIGTSDTSLDCWLKGDRYPIEAIEIMMEYLEDRPEFLAWLEARYQRKYGASVPKKGKRS